MYYHRLLLLIVMFQVTAFSLPAQLTIYPAPEIEYAYQKNHQVNLLMKLKMSKNNTDETQGMSAKIENHSLYWMVGHAFTIKKEDPLRAFILGAGYDFLGNQGFFGPMLRVKYERYRYKGDNYKYISPEIGLFTIASLNISYSRNIPIESGLELIAPNSVKLSLQIDYFIQMVMESGDLVW
jgi:hypothetical protein